VKVKMAAETGDARALCPVADRLGSILGGGMSKWRVKFGFGGGDSRRAMSLNVLPMDYALQVTQCYAHISVDRHKQA
jgi:hypothetical protein